MTGRYRLAPRRSRRLLSRALALLLAVAAATVHVPSVGVLASEGGATASPSPTPLPFSWTLPIVVEATSVFVVDLARGERLYEKNTLEPVSLPVANRVMTALIALEEYAPDAKVTISKVAADADAGKLGLKRGEKVELEYLLLGLLLQDSAAAGIAIAEQVSGEESEFVRKMNVRASNLQMTGTAFVNATGADAEGQRSTVEDAVLLIRTALTQDTFKRIFQLRDSLYFLPDSNTHHFRSRMDSAWSFLDSMTGGIRSDSATGASMAMTARSRGFSILVVSSGSPADKVVTDLTRIVDGVYGHYESITLVSAGQVFPQRESVQGVEFTVVYGASVTYVRPIGADYLKGIRYESLGRTSLPLRRSQAVGKAVFEMVDGSSIRVDMFPESDVYNPKSELDAIRAVVDANPDLAALIAVLAGLLVLLLLGSVAERVVQRLRRPRQRERVTAGRIRRP